jgi:hypothetical protein
LSSATSSASPNERWSSAITTVMGCFAPCEDIAGIVGPDPNRFTYLRELLSISMAAARGTLAEHGTRS